ncbi:MAG: glycosyltransferase family 9 protein [Oligoflexia bacterium]
MNPFLSHPKKLLAIKLRSLGDTALLGASLDALHAAYPDAQIHIAVPTPWAPLFIHHPAIDRIWPVDRHQDKIARGKAIARAALLLRKEGFDAALNFHASPSSATLALATGARVRAVNFHSGKAKNRYSSLEIPGHNAPNQASRTILERDLDTVRALGVQVPEGKFRPSVHLKPSEMNSGFQMLEAMGLRRPILALGLGSSRPTKHWGEDKFAEVAAGWTSRTGGGVLLITGPGEQARAQSVLQQIGALGAAGSSVGHLHNAELRVLAAGLSQSAAYGGNDSGPKHIAAAVGIPTVTVFGPEAPDQWHCYSTDRHPYFYIPALPCRKDALPGNPDWCALQKCDVEKHRCMTSITVAPVLDACIRVATEAGRQ